MSWSQIEISHMPRGCRLETLPLVCKLWNGILKGPSRIWSHVIIKFPTDYKGLKEWLHRRAEAIKELDVYIADPVQPRTYEATLLIGSLIATAIDSTTLRDLRILGGNKLDMNCQSWLPNLSALEHLYLEERHPDPLRFFPSWFLSINYLPQLISLEIMGDEYDLPYTGSKEYRSLPAALALMTHLQVLRLREIGICAFAEDEFTEDIVQAIAGLTTLRELVLTGFEFMSVNPLRSLISLEKLSLSWGPYIPFDARPLRHLREFKYEFYGNALQMRDMALSLPDGLMSLKISTLGIWRRDADGGLGQQEREDLILGLLENRINFPSTLTEIDLSGLGLQVVPTPVLSLRSLQSLSLGYNRLSGLPAGDWLQSLQHVDLTHNRITTGPQPLRFLLPRIDRLVLNDNPGPPDASDSVADSTEK